MRDTGAFADWLRKRELTIETAAARKEYLLAEQQTSAVDYALVSGEKVYGTWTFAEWDKDDFQIYEDTTITGGWIFTPDTYSVTYVVNADPTYGKPEDSTVPTDPSEYTWGETVNVEDQLTTMQRYADKDGEKIPGTWTFKEWDTLSYNAK